MRRLLVDTRGEATTGMLGFTLTWFVVFSVFLMNVQLGQLFHRRDIVDHAAAVAADSAMKTYCRRAGGDRAGAEREALRAIEPLIETAARGPRSCVLSVEQNPTSADPGAASLDVSLSCAFDCRIPLAAQVMCKQGRVSFASTAKTVALGCDGKGG